MKLLRLGLFEVVLLIALLNGCATTRNYERYLDQWVGKDRQELVGKMGQPDRIHSFVDGKKAYEYRFKDVYGGTNTSTRETSAIPTGCTTFFFIDPESGQVLSWKWVGDGCLAK